MQFPTLTEVSQSREMIDAFGGYNHNRRIAGNAELSCAPDGNGPAGRDDYI